MLLFSFSWRDEIDSKEREYVYYYWAIYFLFILNVDGKKNVTHDFILVREKAADLNEGLTWLDSI